MSSVPTSPLPPPRVPDHELIRRIGRGAYGEVWIARSVTGAYRAVKIVQRQSFDHDRPFEREFEGILKFEPISRTHDSQVDILHVGRGEDCFYYVMELADDQSTGGQINPDAYAPRTLKSDLMFHGRIPFEECVRIGLALATALEHLHAADLVHRDVKPSNIIFVNGVPKLADIGLVTGVDATRSYVGTEGFAAPEGSGTVQADLYSLGKVLYEISTGKDRQEFPELPTQLRELPDRDGLMELNAVIAKACRHDPKDRYNSATAMRADLELLQGGKSLARLHRMQTQLRLVRRVGVLVTMLAAIIGAGWLWQARQTQVVRELADQKSRLVEEKSKLAGENRQRIVRLDVANGMRLLNEGDPAAALLWLADALPLVTNNAAETSIHRIRIHSVMQAAPVFTGLFQGEEAQNLLFLNLDDTRLLVHEGPIPRGPRTTRLWDLTAGKPLPGPLNLVTDVTHLAMSADGKLSATAHAAGSARVWTSFDGVPVGGALSHEASVNHVSFSADGALVVTASDDQTAQVWRLDTTLKAGPALSHTQKVSRAYFARGGRQVITCTADGAVHGWDRDTLQRVWSTPCRDHSVGHLAFSPDGRYVATADGRFQASRVTPDTCDVLEAHTGRRLLPGLKHAGSVHHVEFSPDGRRLVTAGGDAFARIWDVASGTQLEAAMPHKAAVWCAVFSPDGRQIATGSADNTARVWDAATGQPLTPPLTHNDDVWSVSFGRDGTTLFTASGDGLIRQWRWLPRNSITAATDVHSSTRQFVFASREAGLHIALANGTPLVWDGTSTNRPQPALPNAAALRVSCFSLDGTRLLGLDTNDFVQIWSMPGSRLLSRWRHLGPRFGSARFSPDASLLVAISEVGDAMVLDPGTGRLLRKLSSRGGFRNAGLSADNLWLTTLADDSKPQVWSLADGRPQLGSDFTGHMKFLPVFSPDGRHVLLGSWPDESWQSVRVWDLATWQPITPDLRHSHYLHAAVFSPDGRRVATAGGDFLVKIWAADGGHLLTPPLVHDGEVISLAISHDGNLLATGTASGNVRVWDARTGEPITPRMAQPQAVSRLQFSLDGRWLAIGGAQGHVGLWTVLSAALPSDVLSDYAALIAGSRLSQDGLLLPMNAGELSALAASLRGRAPQLFE